MSLSLNGFVTSEETFHIFRITHGASNPLGLHTHSDFAEVFFVESGEGYHLVNGERVPLQPGSIVFIRPEDNHTVVSRDDDTNITIINTAFYKETLTFFKDRYFPDCNRFFFTQDRVPFHLQIDKTQLEKLVQWADQVIQLPWNNRILDPFLLKICGLEEKHPDMAYSGQLPDWLLYALSHYNEPADFRKGARGFVKLAGRSPEHIHRMLKKYLNQSLSETVNLARIRYAARQLAMTDQKILAIAMETHFNSLGYFYKCFKKELGITPNQYRKKYRNII